MSAHTPLFGRLGANFCGSGIAALAILSICAGAARADPSAQVSLPVPVHVIKPGSTITDQEIVDKAFGPEVQRLAVHQRRDEVVGKIARRTLPPGRPIPISLLKAPFLVVPGEPVAVVFRSGGIEIRGRAMPLQAGAEGDLVSCRNTDSGLVFRGRVVSPGLVSVGAP